MVLRPFSLHSFCSTFSCCCVWWEPLNDDHQSNKKYPYFWHSQFFNQNKGDSEKRLLCAAVIFCFNSKITHEQASLLSGKVNPTEQQDWFWTLSRTALKKLGLLAFGCLLILSLCCPRFGALLPSFEVNSYFSFFKLSRLDSNINSATLNNIYLIKLIKFHTWIYSENILRGRVGAGGWVGAGWKRHLKDFL